MPLFGRNDQEDQAHAINGLLQSIIEGHYGGYGGGNWLNKINDYYNQAGMNLYGQAQRSAGGAGTLAGGIASSQGLNPYALIMRARNNAYSGFANSMGNLESERARTLSQQPQQTFENLLKLIQGRAATTSGMSQGGGLDSILGDLMGNAGSFMLGKLFGAF